MLNSELVIFCAIYLNHMSTFNFVASVTCGSAESSSVQHLAKAWLQGHNGKFIQSKATYVW